MPLQTPLDAPLRTPEPQQQKVTESVAVSSDANITANEFDASSQDPLLENLIAWYDFDSSAGSKVVDLHTDDTGGSQNLTDNNTVQRISGSSTDVSTGQAADFDGTSDYFNSTDSDLLQDTTSSLALIIHPNSADPGSSFGVWNDSASWLEFGVKYTESSGIPQISFWAGGFEEDTVNISDDTTYFVVARWDQSAGETVLQVRSPTGSSWVSASSTNALSSFDGTGDQFILGHDTTINYFEGWIDSVAYWTEYISDQDRDDYYNGGSGIQYPGPLSVAESFSVGLTGSFSILDGAPISESTSIIGTPDPVVGHEPTYSTVFESQWNLDEAQYLRENTSIGGATPQGVYMTTDTESSEPVQGSMLYILDTDSGTFQSYRVPKPYDTSTASKRLNYDYEQDTLSFLEGIHFKPDGSKLFAVAVSNNRVESWSLSDPWNLGSINYDNSRFDTSGQTLDGPSGIFIRDDGNRMYITGVGNDKVYEYHLSTSWDHTSATFQRDFSLSGQTEVPDDLSFKDDGTRMYIADSENGRIVQYNLSTAWDVTSATYDRAINSQNNNPRGLFVSRDGRWIVTSQSDTGGTEDYRMSSITAGESFSFQIATTTSTPEFALADEQLNFPITATTPTLPIKTIAGESSQIPITPLFDPTEAALSSENFSLGSIVDISFDANYVIVENPVLSGISSVEVTEAGKVGENAASVATYQMEVFEVGISNEKASPTATLKTNNITEATLASEDLRIQLTRLLGFSKEETIGIENASTSLSATIILDEFRPPVLENSQVSAQSGFKINEIGITDVRSDVVIGRVVNQVSSEAIISENTLTTSSFEIFSISHNVTNWSIGVINFEKSFDPELFNPLLDGLTFENNGKKMYFGNTVTENILEYSLSTPYEINEANQTGSLSLSINQISGLEMLSDGSSLFVTDGSSKIYEYKLSTNYRINNVKNKVTHDFSGSVSTIEGIEFSRDEKELYLINDKLDDRIQKYELSSSGDLSTASFDDSFAIGKKNVNDLHISPNRQLLFLLEKTDPDNFVLKRYGFDSAGNLSSAVFWDQANLAKDSFKTGLHFRSDGKKMYYLGQETNKIYQYKLTGNIFETPTLNINTSITNKASTGITNISSTPTYIVGFDVNETGSTVVKANNLEVNPNISPNEFRPPVPEDVIIGGNIDVNQFESGLVRENSLIGTALVVFITDEGTTTLTSSILENYNTSVIHEALASDGPTIRLSTSLDTIPPTTNASEKPEIGILMDSTVSTFTRGTEEASVSLEYISNFIEDGRTSITSSLSIQGSVTVFDILSFIESVEVKSNVNTSLREITEVIEKPTPVLIGKIKANELGRTTLTTSINDIVAQNIVDIGISGVNTQVSGTYIISTTEDSIATERRKITSAITPFVDEFRPPVLEKPQIRVVSKSQINDLGFTALTTTVNSAVLPNITDNLVVSPTVAVESSIQNFVEEKSFAEESVKFDGLLLTSILDEALLTTDPINPTATLHSKIVDTALAGESVNYVIVKSTSITDRSLATENYTTKSDIDVNVFDLGRNEERVQILSISSVNLLERAISKEITKTVVEGYLDAEKEKTFATENSNTNVLTSILTDEKIVIFEEPKVFSEGIISVNDIGIARSLVSVNAEFVLSLIDQSLGRFSSETGANTPNLGRSGNDGVLGRAINDGSLIRHSNTVEKSDRTQNDIEKK